MRIAKNTEITLTEAPTARFLLVVDVMDGDVSLTRDGNTLITLSLSGDTVVATLCYSDGRRATLTGDNARGKEVILTAGYARMGLYVNGALVDENRQSETEGIFACGNVLQVHDLVDYVSDEAQIAGKSAADYVRGELLPSESIPTVAKNGVRYVLPQRVNKNAKEDVALFLRVSSPYGKVRFTVRSQDSVLATKTCLKATPGEMEKIVIKREKLSLASDDISVELEELQ